MDLLQQNQNSTLKEIKAYTIPKLYTGKEWYVGFMAYDPVSKSLKRKKIKLNHIDKIGERRKYADGLIKRLNYKLEKGWNPWIEADNEKAYKTFEEVCGHYKTIILKLTNDGILREDTYRDYISKIKNIEE